MGEERGRQRLSPDADLLLDGTINHPKTYSIAALLHPELATEFEALQDRLRDRILLTWRSELNARRGHNGVFREDIARIEVVELRHRRSRALDPHIHRHLWLNIKVLGADGKWSNLDSRVAMKLHTVINAEGELAARTDPAWIAALGRHGYTLDAQGEIAELAGAVRPLSRRSAQIESNRARLIAEWSATHGGSAPSVKVLQQIDRRAWAVARRNKPADIDETSWASTVRDEIAAIDPALVAPRASVSISGRDLHDLDVEFLAAQAVVDADERSTSTGGLFSLFGLRAGAIRALSRTGIVAERSRLDGVIVDVTERATRAAYRLDGGDLSGHVKVFMATETVHGKLRLAGALEALARPGRSLLPNELGRMLMTKNHGQVRDAKLFIDGQDTRAFGMQDSDYLMRIVNRESPGTLSEIRHVDSSVSRPIQLADMVAGAINRRVRTDRPSSAAHLTTFARRTYQPRGSYWHFRPRPELLTI